VIGQFNGSPLELLDRLRQITDSPVSFSIRVPNSESIGSRDNPLTFRGLDVPSALPHLKGFVKGKLVIE